MKLLLLFLLLCVPAWQSPFSLAGITLDMKEAEVLARLGPPRQRLPHPRGGQRWVYDNQRISALSFKDGRVYRLHGFELSQNGKPLLVRGDASDWLVKKWGQPQRRDPYKGMDGWVYLGRDRVVVVYVNERGIRGVTYQHIE